MAELRTPGVVTCTKCGRRIDVRWPTRSLVCSCGARLIPREPDAATDPGTRSE